MAKVSIVVAAYNVEDHIREALDSVIGQTMQDIEIVCVDDCSIDATAEILEEYAARDERVRVIRHAENRGSFAVRHTGAAAAAGEYVLFLDGDDAYVPQACERLYEKAAAEKLDVVDSGAELLVSEGCGADENLVSECALYFSHAPKTIPKSRAELLHACFVEKDIRWSMCAKLCALQLVKKAWAFFGGERITMAEDALAAFMVFYHARAYGYLDEWLYRYRWGSGISTGDVPPTVQRLQSVATEYQVYPLLCKWLSAGQREESGAAEALEALRIKVQDDIFHFFLQRALPEDCPAFLKAILQYCTLEEFVFDLAETAARRPGLPPEQIAFRLRDCEELFPRQKKIGTVASFCRHLAEGGAGRAVALLAPIWQNAGYQVVVVTEQEPDPLDYPLPEGVCRAVIPEERNSKGRMTAWQRILREYQIDAVVYHEWISDGRMMDALAVKSQQIPFILYTHPLDACRFHRPDRLRFPQEAVDALSDVVVAASEVDEAWWQALGYRAVCIPEPHPFYPAEVQPSALQGHHVLWTARSAPENWCYDAFEIASLVHRRIPDFQLHVVGGAESTEDYEQIRKFLAQNQMTSYVILHGNREDVETCFQKASAMLLTSDFEDPAMTVAESKTFGVPLVAYELPAVSAIRRAEGMFVVPRRDRPAAADRLVQLLEDEGLRRRMGAAARRGAKALAEFDFGGHWKKIFDLAAAPRERHAPLYRQPPLTTALCIVMRKVGEDVAQAADCRRLQRENTQYAVTVQEIQNSTAYRLGMRLTAFPRRLKGLLGKWIKR